MRQTTNKHACILFALSTKLIKIVNKSRYANPAQGGVKITAKLTERTVLALTMICDTIHLVFSK